MFLSQTKVYFQALYSLFPGLYCISGKDVSNWDKESRGQDRRCYLCRTLGSRTWSHKELNCVLVVLQRALTVSVLYDLEVSPTYRLDKVWRPVMTQWTTNQNFIRNWIGILEASRNDQRNFAVYENAHVVTETILRSVKMLSKY